MGNALISRRGGGYATVKFENYSNATALPTRCKVTNLSETKVEIGATSLGNYALFAGGDSWNTSTSSTNYYSTVDAFDINLSRSTPTSLSEAKYNVAATTVGNYALFGGGSTGSSNYCSTVDTYTSSLAKGTATSLSQARYSLAATTVGSYALFGGGQASSYSSTVDAYNSSLTRSTPTALSNARSRLKATTVGNYALFGGGAISGGTTTSTVDAYNTSLVRSTPTSLSQSRHNLGATTVGNYALFGGGDNNSTPIYSTVDAYNSSLTRSTPTALSQPRSRINATTIGNNALFAGGYSYIDSAYIDIDTVDSYNSSLTRNTLTSYLSQAREYISATTLGCYAFFAGGILNSEYLSTVDVFAVQVELSACKGSKYKFQNMSSETTVSSDIENITISCPATGYIKFKNTTIS